MIQVMEVQEEEPRGSLRELLRENQHLAAMVRRLEMCLGVSQGWS